MAIVRSVCLGGRVGNGSHYGQGRLVLLLLLLVGIGAGRPSDCPRRNRSAAAYGNARPSGAAAGAPRGAAVVAAANRKVCSRWAVLGHKRRHLLAGLRVTAADEILAGAYAANVRGGEGGGLQICAAGAELHCGEAIVLLL